MSGPTPAELAKLATNRSALAAAQSDRAGLVAERTSRLLELTAAESELVGLRAEGASTTKITAATRKAETSRRRLATIESDLLKVDDRIAGVVRQIDTLKLSKADPAWALTSTLPVALCPVRLETRFVHGALRIRIFPDVVHVDQLEPELSAEEIALGAAYWGERWTTTGAAIAELWDRYTATGNARRVAWVVHRTTPVNIDSIGVGSPTLPTLTPRTGPTRAAVATLLPARWTAIGLREGSVAFRKSSAAVGDSLALTPRPIGASDPITTVDDAVQTELPVDDAIRWLSDYDRALAAGMAITVTAADVQGGDVMAGFDRIVVVGVDHRNDPAATADHFESVLLVHAVTHGVGFVAHGTSTNATSEDAVAPRPCATDPTVVPAAPAPSSAAARFASAMGVSSTAAARLIGGDLDHDPIAEPMHTALWEPTLGYFLQQMMSPLLDEAQIAAFRTHFRRYVRGRGPLPLLRVGDQPLGILPVTAVAHFQAAGPESLIVDAVRGVKQLWESSLDKATQLGSSGDPAADLVELLQRTERSALFRLRDAIGPTMLANTEGARAVAEFQQALGQLLLAALGVTGRPRIVDVVIREDQVLAFAPLISAELLSETAPLTPDYIATIGARLVARFGYLQLREDSSSASALLHALLIFASEVELARASFGLIIEHLHPSMSIINAMSDPEFMPGSFTSSPDREPVAFDVIGDGTPMARFSITAAQAPDQVIDEIGGSLPLGAYLAEQQPGSLMRKAQTRQYGEFRSALDALVGQPTAELDRAAADVLDVVSHRFDAWATSLATRRLAEQRAITPTGLQIGAYGWVDDLRPRQELVSSGYIHAPSIVQATTAAILRSGHLARTDAAAEPLAIDLRSRRVREATKLLEGMRSGQSLAALLGYRFERALRDRGVTFAKYILPTRLQYPLAGSGDADAGGRKPTEAIAARNVVDGVALAELDADGRQQLLTAIAASAVHRGAITAELDSLADHLDAVADLLMSEGVFQAVAGNVDRAAAALDAVDRQGPLPETGVTRTPRSGTGISHRLLVVLDAKLPLTWGRAGDVRAKAEPRVNAWVGAVLGNPAQFQFAADVIAADGTIATTVAVGLDELNLSPLSAVLAATQGGEQRSELEQRIVLALAPKVPDPRMPMRLRAGPPPGAKSIAVGLADFVAIARAIVDLLGAARAANINDLIHPNDRTDQTPDAAEIAARADAAAAELRAVAALGDRRRVSSVPWLTASLERGAALGIRGAVPQRGADIGALDAQLTAVIDAAKLIAAELGALEGRFDPVSSPHAAAEHHAARLRAVLGERLPVVPLTKVSNQVAAALDRSLSDPALAASRPAAVVEWVLQHTRVRAPVERLWRVLATAEARATDVDATQFTAAQLPAVLGDVWVGMPEAFADGPPSVDTSFVIHRSAARGAPLGSSVAALVIDQWFEHVPSADESTGVAFQFDAPGARAPQSILLAVHPDPSLANWTTDLLLDTVCETADLARLRTIDLDDVDAAGRFLPATYLPFNLAREVPSFTVGVAPGRGPFEPTRIED